MRLSDWSSPSACGAGSLMASPCGVTTSCCFGFRDSSTTLSCSTIPSRPSKQQQWCTPDYSSCLTSFNHTYEQRRCQPQWCLVASALRDCATPRPQYRIALQCWRASWPQSGRREGLPTAARVQSALSGACAHCVWEDVLRLQQHLHGYTQRWMYNGSRGSNLPLDWHAAQPQHVSATTAANVTITDAAIGYTWLNVTDIASSSTHTETEGATCARLLGCHHSSQFSLIWEKSTAGLE